MNGIKEALPGKGARAMAWAAGLLLTLCLFLAAATARGILPLADGGMLEKAMTAPAVLDAQEKRISEQVLATAKRNGLAPEGLPAVVPRDELETLNRASAERLTAFLQTGTLGEAPAWEAEAMTEALWQAFSAEGADPETAEEKIYAVAERFGGIVSETVSPFRETALRLAEKTLKSRVQMPAVYALLQRLPGLLGAACLLLAGLIALAVSRKISRAFRYIGAAMIAAGLLLALALLTVRLLSSGGLPAGDFPVLAAEYAELAGAVRGSLLAAAAALIVPGAALLAGSLWAGKRKEATEKP